MAENDGRQTRVRCNIERTASNKVVRAITFEHVMGEAVTLDEAVKDIERSVALFLHLEGQLQKNGIIE